MSRSVPEWIGKTPDTAVPPRVRLRVFERCHGRCGQCSRKIASGEAWTCEHIIALINGGENRERNLGVTCCWCLPEKNAADVAEKSTAYRKRKKYLGLRSTKRPMPCGRDSEWKKPFGGGPAVRRHP